MIDETVPQSIRQEEPLDWGAPLSEAELIFRMRQVASRNKVLTSLIGQGYHGTVTPPAIQRNIFENPAWYTAYTPYQPEISQGRLEALLNFQTIGVGPDRPAGGQCLSPGRGDGLRRGDDHGAPAWRNRRRGPSLSMRDAIRRTSR